MTPTTTSSSPLFRPGVLGALALPNRVVMAPMTRNRATADHVPSDVMETYYTQRASAGLIITEMTHIAPEAVGYPNSPGIHNAGQVAGWRRITTAVHAAGGRIVLQIAHAGRISHPTTQPNGAIPVAPSALTPEGTIPTAVGMQPFITPRALESAEIPDIVAQFAEAARLAREAGFDGVELHAANGYLLDQFLRDGSNRRADEYGGSVANRVRLLREVATAVVESWSADRIGVRLSPHNPYNSMADADPEATFVAAAETLGKLGLAYLHIVEGDRSLTPALAVAFGGPVLVNGGYDKARADAVLRSGTATAVSFGAPFLANPDLPRRLAMGAPLNEPQPATFYGGDHRGYLDYPALSGAA